MVIIGSCDPQNRLKSPYRISPRNPSPPKVYRKKVICVTIITIFGILTGLVDKSLNDHQKGTSSELQRSWLPEQSDEQYSD